MRRGCLSRRTSAPKPSLPAAPGARFWTKTSARSTRRLSISRAASCFRFNVRDSFDRLSHTKWLERPLTVLSYPRAKSPTSGRSTFITRAPRSASWRVAKGAATACSRETTVMPSSGSISERPRQPEHVLSHVGEDEVGRDGSYFEEPGLAELALDVVPGVEAVAAEGLHRGVCRLPGGVGCQQQGHVGLCSAGFARVEQFGGPEAHEVRGLHAYVRLRYGELDALVLADGSAEDDALRGTAGGLIYEPPSVADALGGDEDPFGVHAVEDVPEALAFLADQAARRDAQVLEEEFVSLVVDHHTPGLHRQPVAHGLAQIDEEHGQPLGLPLRLIQRRGPGQQDHEVRVLDARDVHLSPVDDVMIAVSHGGRPQGGRVAPGLRLGHAEGLQPQLTARYLRQVLPLLLLRAVFKHGAHHVHLGVCGLGVASGAVDLFEDDRSLGEAQAQPTVFLRDERAEVAAFRHRLDKGFRVLSSRVELAPVAVREIRAHLADSSAQILVLVGAPHVMPPAAGFARPAPDPGSRHDR